jgi:uncharacterized membrane protein
LKDNTVQEEFIYHNKNNLFVWVVTTIIMIAMVAGGIIYFIYPFRLIGNRETMFMAFYITLSPLVIFLLYLMIRYYISMVQTGNRIHAYTISKKEFHYKHHITGGNYIEEKLEFSTINRCIISRNIVEVRKSNVKHRFLVYPVIHLIYDDYRKHILLKHTDYSKDAMNFLLHTLKELHIPLEYTDRQLYLIPEQDLLEMVNSEKVVTQTYPFHGDIFIQEEFRDYTSEKPEPEMGQYYRKLVRQNGITAIRYPVWIVFLTQFLTFLLIFIGAVYRIIDANSLLFTYIIPYIVITFSYIFYFYRIKKTKYWKSILHWLFSQMAITIACFVVGVIRSSPETMLVFEEMTYINLGLHFASFILYFIVVVILRQKWPAAYHEETKLAQEHVIS